LFYSAHYSTYLTRRRLILAGSGTLILCNVQITMKFKMFNATTMHNSPEKRKKKIRLKSKKNLI